MSIKKKKKPKNNNPPIHQSKTKSFIIKLEAGLDCICLLYVWWINIRTELTDQCAGKKGLLDRKKYNAR